MMFLNNRSQSTFVLMCLHLLSVIVFEIGSWPGDLQELSQEVFRGLS